MLGIITFVWISTPYWRSVGWLRQCFPPASAKHLWCAERSTSKNNTAKYTQLVLRCINSSHYRQMYVHRWGISELCCRPRFYLLHRDDWERERDQQFDIYSSRYWMTGPSFQRGSTILYIIRLIIIVYTQLASRKFNQWETSVSISELKGKIHTK